MLAGPADSALVVKVGIESERLLNRSCADCVSRHCVIITRVVEETGSRQAIGLQTIESLEITGKTDSQYK